MDKRETILIAVFIAALSSVNLYVWSRTEKNIDMIHQCSHQQTSTSLEVKKEVERRLKSIEHFIINSRDVEKLELNAEIADLEWQNEKLRREFLNLYNLMRGRDIPAYTPKGRIKI